MSENSTNQNIFTDEERENSNQLVNKQLQRIQSDIDFFENKSNVYHNARILYYGPTFILMFASYFSLFIFRDNFDIANVTIAAYLVFCIHNLMSYNYSQLDGKNGRIEYYGELTQELEDTRNEGIGISVGKSDEDIKSQLGWLQKLKNSKHKSQVESPHPFEANIGKIRIIIRKFRYRISILVPALVVSFLLKELPWDIDEKSNATWIGFFAPEYLQQLLCPECTPVVSILCGIFYSVLLLFVFFASMHSREMHIEARRNNPDIKDII